MNRTLLIIGSLFFSLTAFARLGDTPEEAEKRYGKATEVSPNSTKYQTPVHKWETRVYFTDKLRVQEVYLNGKCVGITISNKGKGVAFQEALLPDFIKANFDKETAQKIELSRKEEFASGGKKIKSYVSENNIVNLQYGDTPETYTAFSAYSPAYQAGFNDEEKNEQAIIAKQF